MKQPGSAVLCLCLALSFARASAAATLSVDAGGDLQAAINSAQPGDTILLQAGATFTGAFKLPVKGGTTYITIRSSASDAELPADGQRMTPAYAALLPKVRATNAGSAFRTAAAATYWRLLFIELLPAASNASADLVEFGAAGPSQSTLASVPQHLVIDRCFLHGDASFGQRRGLALNSGDTQVLNSYFADFKGVLQDTQAIAGWNGPGPYLIENNYLEAAGENVMFGGSDPNIPNLVPSDITIRRNDINKPTAWMTQSWTVKNLLEFKNAENVLLEGNTIEHNWAAGQQGYSIVFTPRNQGGTAPWSVVKHVVVQNNVIRHVAAGFNILGYDNLATAQQTDGVTIRNNLAYDISTAWMTAGHPANGRFAIIGGGPKNITIDHNTVDNDGNSTVYIYGGFAPTGAQIANFDLTNNLIRDNLYGIYGDRFGEGTLGLNAYCPSAVVLRNTFAGGAAKQYPTGNDFPALVQWLADFVSVSSANYQLGPSSLSRSSATDGKDLGVDFAELDAALAVSTAAPPPPAAVAPPAAGPAPFTGAPITLPGTVEFENYDKGVEGVAYHDTTSGNTGAAYRSDAVDIQATTDTGGGYNVGWVKAGEWLNYSVNVATAGTYAIDVRAASNGVGGTFHVEIDGVDQTGPIAIPNTGAWQIWQTLTKTGVTFAAGPHVMRVFMDSAGPGGSVGNFNWFAIR